MTAHAGEKVRESRCLRCERCSQLLRLEPGQRIPECPQCGNHTFSNYQAEAPEPAAS